MIFVKILLFIVILPLRLAGTVLGGVLHIIGLTVCAVNAGVGFIFRFVGIGLEVIMAAASLFCFFNFHGMGELPNWGFWALCGIGTGAALIMLANFGDSIGEALADWGSELVRVSWKMIDL